MGLSEVDLNIVIEAMDEWVQKGAVGNLVGSLLTSMMVKREDPKSAESWQREQAAEKMKYEDEKRSRMEIATIIKAKLIMMKRDVQSRAYEGQDVLA